MLQSFVDSAREPLESFLDQVSSHPAWESIGDERARLLFHARFGLGLLLLVESRLKSDMDIEAQAMAVLHEMVCTQLSWTGLGLHSGPGIVESSPDMVKAKLFTASFVPTIYPFQEREKFSERFLYESQILRVFGPQDDERISGNCDLLEVWAAKCDEFDNTGVEDFPNLEWIDLFAAAAIVLSASKDVDSSAALPCECHRTSPQYLAWKFGHMAGRFADPENRFYDDPFTHFLSISDTLDDEDIFPERELEQATLALNTVLALLVDYDPACDLHRLRERYLALWSGSSSFPGMSLDNIGPDTDLYWAMRIGFLDRALEKEHQAILVPHPSQLPPVVRAIESTKNIVETMALWMLRVDQSTQTLLERSPASKEEIYKQLERRFYPIRKEIPSKILNRIVKAERYYQIGVDDDDAKLWFCRAVEASFKHCFLTPLVDSMEKHRQKQMPLCFPLPRGLQRMSIAQIRKISLGEWGDILRTVNTSPRKGFSSLGTGDLAEFMKSHLGALRLPDLHSLAQHLSECQKYRGGSAHYQEADSRY
ncbi:MAG: hypothetical protein J7K94_06100 [Dehalococcoidia bacterium]|nr:hypothetical protein [Dehalococcoidia bacterium]